MKKKEFKKNIIDNIEKIDVLENIKKHSNEACYQKEIRIKPFSKLKFALVTMSVIVISAFIIMGFKDDLPQSFDPNEEAAESVKSEFDIFYNYYIKLDSNTELSREELELILNSFKKNKTIDEIVNEYNLNDEKDVVIEMYNYYLNNLK